MTKAAFDRGREIELSTISQFSLKHLARQKSAWHCALVSQHPQSFEACFVLPAQSGMSALLVACACANAAIAAPTGASVTPSAINEANSSRYTAKATSGATIPATRGRVKLALAGSCWHGFNSPFLIASGAARKKAHVPGLNVRRPIAAPFSATGTVSRKHLPRGCAPVTQARMNVGHSACWRLTKSRRILTFFGGDEIRCLPKVS